MTGQDVTVRELGGEIYVELDALSRQRASPFDRLDWEVLNAAVDVIMGVLARHEQSVILNDKDLPVVALPPRGESGRE